MGHALVWRESCGSYVESVPRPMTTVRSYGPRHESLVTSNCSEPAEASASWAMRGRKDMRDLRSLLARVAGRTKELA